MRRILPLLAFLPLFVMSARAHDGHTTYPFIQNKGQWVAPVLYKADLPGGNMWIEPQGISYGFFDHAKLVAIHDHFEGHEGVARTPEIRAHALRIRLLGSDPLAEYTQEHASVSYNNYFLGTDPSRWATDVYAYGEVRGKNIYPGIDVLYKQDEGFLKYEFVVAPGADPAQIAMQYQGQEQMYIDELGNLNVKTSLNLVKEMRPFIYQLRNGDTLAVPGRFELKENIVRFVLDAEYDKDLPLVIDPVLIFSTYSGSTADNFGFTATYDSKGYLYSGGNVFALGYPTTPGAYQVNYGGGNIDVAITKYDITGTFLIFSTYLGGNGSEIPHSLVVNNYDELFVFGTTGSNNFPTSSNAFDKTFNGGTSVTGTGMGFVYPSGCDIFVTRFNQTGTGLLASTYLGGTGNDGLNLAGGLKHNYADDARGEIDIDNSNYIYLATTTSSSNFPGTSGGFQASYGGGTQDGIVIKMDNGLTSLLWSSYIGGSGADAIYSLALSNNHIVIAGGTNSANFPANGTAFNTPSGGVDGFVARINATGNTLIKASLYGTSQYDQIYFVEADKNDHIFVLGQTDHSAGFYFNNAIYGNPAGNQFITKFKPGLDQVEWSTAFGNGNGHPDISPSAFLVDVCNKIYISGWGGTVNGGFIPGSTVSGLDITPGAYQSSTTGSDFYLMVMEDNASSLTYSTFFGGPTSAEHVDGGTSRFNRKGEIYQSVCAGCGAHSDFPIFPSNAWSPTNNSPNCNNGVFKFKFDFPMTVADFDIPPSGCAPVNMSFVNLSEGATSYQWSVSDGQTSTAANPTFTFTNSGVYQVTLYALNGSGTTCNPVDSVTKQVVVLGNNAQDLPNMATCESTPFEIGMPPSGVGGVTYQWLPSTGLSDPTVSNPIFNPAAGTQTYQLIIANSACSDTIAQTVTVDPLQNIQFSDTLVCEGTVVNVGSNNLPPAYTYQWIPSSGLSNPNIANPTYTAVAPASFKLVYSYLTCSDTARRNVAVLTPDAFNMNDTSICSGDTIQIHEIPAFPGVTYQWFPPAQVSDDTLADPQVWADTTTLFTCIISNGICQDTVSKLVNIFAISAMAGDDTVICKGDTVGIGFPPQSGYVYSWTPSSSLSNDSISDPLAFPLGNTSYILSVSLQNGGQCAAYDTVNINIRDFGIPPYGFTSGPSCYGLIVTPDLVGNPAYQYYWNVQPGGIYDGQNPSFLIPYKDTAYISLVVSDGICKDSVTVSQTIGAFGDYYDNNKVPNVFTPNEDGMNECFGPGNLDPSCYRLYVYNRWGQLYFDSEKAGAECWNGRAMNKGEIASEGVYYWILEIALDEYHGTVHLFTKK
ncbi:MAG: gliding motility-associated C-terminal domain-containing protein [Bacteroidia bacterium]|nr:gliding motility-associated C-terminal domain-containing protein [Bacteroidia bacterium]